MSSHPLTSFCLLCCRTQYSGIVNDKSVGIEAAPKGRGVVVSTRKTKSAPNQVANTRSEYVVKKGGSRRAAGKVANIVAKNGYRPDLRKVSWRGEPAKRVKRFGGGGATRARKERKPLQDSLERQESQSEAPQGAAWEWWRLHCARTHLDWPKHPMRGWAY